MKTRNAKISATAISPAQFEAAMEQYTIAERREAQINTMLKGEVNVLLDQYMDELLSLAKGKTEAFEIAQSYCLDNKATLFGKRRSIGTLNAIAGFRLGTPKLKTAKGSSWKNLLVALKETLPAYVRITEEPAKDRLLADRHKEAVAPVLMQLGVSVEQDELFYIETKQAA